MTSEQIGTWLAFDSIEPIGQSWDRTRQAVSYLLMPHGHKKPIEHFRPDSPQREDTQGGQ